MSFYCIFVRYYCITSGKVAKSYKKKNRSHKEVLKIRIFDFVYTYYLASSESGGWGRHSTLTYRARYARAVCIVGLSLLDGGYEECFCELRCILKLVQTE